MDNQIHHFNDLDSYIYLPEDDHNMITQEDDYNAFEVESKQYHRGYQNATDDFQNKLN